MAAPAAQNKASSVSTSVTVNLNCKAAFRLVAAIHSIRVEGQHNISASIDGDESAFTADFRQMFESFPGGVFQPELLILHSRSDVIRCYTDHEKLSVPGAGDRTAFVVGVSSGSNQRGIADAAKLFIGHAAGRGRRCNITLAIARNGADSTERFPILDFGSSVV